MSNIIKVTATKWVNIETILMIDDNGDGTYKVTTSMMNPVNNGTGGGSVVFASVSANNLRQAFAQLVDPPQIVDPIPAFTPPGNPS